MTRSNRDALVVAVIGIGSLVFLQSILDPIQAVAQTAVVRTTAGVTVGGSGTGTQFTLGSVIFAGPNGVYGQSNPDFFWDNTAKRLGIGTTSPRFPLHVHNPNSGSSEIRVSEAINDANSFVSFTIQASSDTTSNNTLAAIATGSNFSLLTGFDSTSLFFSGNDQSKGLAIMTQNANAPVTFYTGGISMGTAKWRMDTAGNLTGMFGKGQHINTQAANNDITGRITITAGTTGTYTFTTDYSNSPNCTLTPTSDATAVGIPFATTTTHVLTANIPISGTITVIYNCTGNPN